MRKKRGLRSIEVPEFITHQQNLYKITDSIALVQELLHTNDFFFVSSSSQQTQEQALYGALDLVPAVSKGAFCNLLGLRPNETVIPQGKRLGGHRCVATLRTRDNASREVKQVKKGKRVGSFFYGVNATTPDFRTINDH
jgi:hypothetical protein